MPKAGDVRTDQPEEPIRPNLLDPNDKKEQLWDVL